jgi:hypothetical protein
MRTPVIVDTPYPTVWQTAKKMGVSRKRTLELIKLADEIMVRRGMKPKTINRPEEAAEHKVRWLAPNVTAHS